MQQIPAKFTEVDAHHSYYSAVYVDYIEELLREAHDKLDEENNSNNIGLDNKVIGFMVYCKYCQPWPPLKTGYDENGLKHEDDCLLVKIREVIN